MSLVNQVPLLRPHWLLQVLAVLVGAWLFVVPQVMNSSTILDLCKEAGSTTLPLIEEESVHHYGTEPQPALLAIVGPPTVASTLPCLEDRILSSFHGDVPHLPPWA